MENTPNSPIDYFRSQIGKTLNRTPSAAGNWLAGVLLAVDNSEIKVSYNSTGKVGKQNSVVRIYSNASEPIEKVSLISNVLTKSN